MIATAKEGIVKISNESDIVAARKEARVHSTEIGFGVTDVTRIVTATSELARNIYRYAGEGIMRWKYINNDSSMGIELQFEDDGPGIDDVEKAMEIGYTTQNGMGMGLPGSKKLMDEMDIDSSPGRGTRVKVVKWLRN